MVDETVTEVAEQAEINTPLQVEALDSPLRMRILKAASEPVAVREIADRLGVPITRLYYHVNMLEEAGFVAVVDSRKSGARLEKIYRITAKSFCFAKPLRTHLIRTLPGQPREPPDLEHEKRNGRDHIDRSKSIT